MENKPKIQVIIRKRPLTSKEVSKKYEDIIDVLSYDTLQLREKKQKVDLTKFTEKHEFTFDAVFDENHDNEYIYVDIVQPLIQAAFEKSKVTCFAYGQTGSGKTWTMMGSEKAGVPGLYLLAADDIFSFLDMEKYSFLRAGVSFYEIYCGKAYDLLNNRNACAIRVDRKQRVNIVGLNEKIIGNKESLVALMDSGLKNRIVSKTGMNNESSRSHAILQITLRNIENGKKYGKLSFIDLAGSERGSDVKDTNSKTRADGAEINKSLLALKECIRALDLAKKHLPFRGSKLTLVLKDSFLGKCQTVMIGNISPSIDSVENTLNTLRYADRVKELKGGDTDKQHKNKDELMLARKKKPNQIEYEKPKTDNHLVFETFDVKSEKPQKKEDKLDNKSALLRKKSDQKSKKKTKSVREVQPQEPEEEEDLEDEMEDEEEEYQEEDEDDDRVSDYQQPTKQKMSNSQRHLGHRKTPSSQFQHETHSQQNYPQPQKSNFLKNNTVTKHQYHQQPMSRQNTNYNRDPRDNRDNRYNNYQKNNTSQHLNQPQSSYNNFQQHQPQSYSKNRYQQNLKQDYQSRSQSRNKDSYSESIKAMIGVTRSDLRNIKRMEQYQKNYFKEIDKLRRNLDEKIRSLNRLKKNLDEYDDFRRQNQRRPSREMMSDEDPFQDRGGRNDLLIQLYNLYFVCLKKVQINNKKFHLILLSSFDCQSGSKCEYISISSLFDIILKSFIRIDVPVFI